MFHTPEAPAPLHTTYWQKDDPPHDIRKWPDDLPGPRGYHMVTLYAYLEWQRRQAEGLEPLCYSSPEGAPPPSGTATPGELPPLVLVTPTPAAPAPPVATGHPTPPASSGRAPRAPRVPRAPRAPRAPRPPRGERPPRPPRPPRQPRFGRKPRRPRPARTPRKPRPPGTKGDEYEYYCGYHLNTGRNAHFGSPIKIKKGDPIPPPNPGTGLRQVSGTYPCGDDQCVGPFAGIITGFFDLLPAAWRPGINQAQLARFNEKNALWIERRNRRLPAISRPTRYPPANPPASSGYYCCYCGHTGGCFTSAGDCRNNLQLAQWRFGQCREQNGIAPPA